MRLSAVIGQELSVVDFLPGWNLMFYYANYLMITETCKNNI